MIRAATVRAAMQNAQTLIVVCWISVYPLRYAPSSAVYDWPWAVARRLFGGNNAIGTQRWLLD